MNEFKVIEIIDEYTIKTQPSWQWSNRDGIQLAGDKIMILGYNVPNNPQSKAFTKQKLTNLLLNNYVSLKNPVEISGVTNTIRCMVYLNNVNIDSYFPEYKTGTPA